MVIEPGGHGDDIYVCRGQTIAYPFKVNFTVFCLRIVDGNIALVLQYGYGAIPIMQVEVQYIECLVRFRCDLRLRR